MNLIAAICTNRTPAEIAPALTAVCDQASEAGDASVLLITSGLGEADRRRHEEAASALGARSVAAQAGLSAARNRALEEAGAEDVVAYLDDDAVVQPGWLPNLIAHWRGAGQEVACIGGAIDPRWERPPPAWVSPRIDHAFTLLDLGPGVVELDPLRSSDAWGANVSFRAGPLLEAGGFEPAFGPWAGVPMFGDETTPQRRLAERGLRVLYAGDVRVWHLIGAERLRLRELWRRELYRGFSAALEGRVSPAGGAAEAARAAAGLGVAAARRDAPLCGERFARVARGTGAAASPLIRRRLRARGWPGP